MKKTKLIWIYWLLVSLLIGGYLGYRMMGENKTVFLPGPTSHGHYQIELACDACHSDAFGGGEVLQDACMQCHGKELKVANDSHPRSKFLDPRNASRVEKLDARLCITCHVEHQPEITTKMGLTVPEDVCVHCHKDIAEDRPSHAGMGFETCASAGCHNFHDNRGLYEDFLLKHVNEPDVLDKPENLRRSFRDSIALVNYPLNTYPIMPLELEDKDVPGDINVEQILLEDWSTTAHALAGVNCSACHTKKDETGKLDKWVSRPGYQVCNTCHESESQTFLEGKHGMRLKQKLSPMTPGMARAPMKNNVHDRELGCESCHVSHKFDTRHAAVEACLGCHNDEHSLAFKDSPHFSLWYRTQSDQALEPTGVSCATCHLPRTLHSDAAGQRVFVQHNQNDNLRPNEKMLRSVCMNCHGLAFAIDALADETLVKNNFNGKPSRHINSIDMAVKRVKDKGRNKKGEDD